jgi:hypothetical protein
MPFVDLVDWYYDLNGRLVKWKRGGSIILERPGAPATLSASLSGGTATLNWTTPLTDGGSPITGYIAINVTTGETKTLGVVLTTTFTGLTGTNYTFTVAAVNTIGTGPTTTAIVSSSTIARFPGDTRPKITGKWLFGIDEGDQDPTSLTSGERVKPEVLSGGVPFSCMRSYFATTSDAGSFLAVPNGGIATRIKNHRDAGRLTFASIHFDNLGLAGDGRNNLDFYNFIGWCETSANVPVHFTCQHEVDGPDNTAALDASWGKLMKTVRWQMNQYADANGGVGVYKWKSFALSFILTAMGYKRGDPVGGVGSLWKAACYTTGVTATAATDTFAAPSAHMLTNGCKVRLLAPPAGAATNTDYYIVQATSTTLKLSATRGGAPINITGDATGVTIIYKELFDFAAVDSYQFPLDASSNIGRTGAPMWQANFKACVAWITDPAHTYPLAITETGVHNNDADAAYQLQQFVEACLDGTNDFIGLYYFNSHGNGTRDPAQWALWNQRDDGGTNGNLATRYVNYMLDPRTLHFWQLTGPGGNTYPKPVGVP